MCLAEISAPLCTLPTTFRPAPLAPAMPDTAIRPPSCALGALRHRTPLPAAMCNTELSPTMNTLWAHAATLERAALSPTVPFTEWGTPFSPLGTPWDSTSLPPTMCLAEHCAPLCSFRALRILAAASASMGDAEARVTFSTLGAVVHLASLATSMPYA